MRIAIIGSGGVGGYFGGKLACAGHDLHFLARGAHLAAMRERGLRVDSISGDFVLEAVQATDDPGAIGPVDLAVVAVKSWQLPEAASAAQPLVASDTVVLPLLNGVEASRILADAVGEEHVFGGICRISARIEGPGHIVHSAIDPSITFGELDNRRTERAAALQRALTEAGIRAEIPSDILAAVWEKFALIATWSGIGAVTRVPIGQWRDLPGTRAMAEACLREIHSVASARGIALGEDRVMKIMDVYDSVPPESVASMQRDVLEGRPSELEDQSGAVVRLGREVQVPVPTHAFLYDVLLPQERKARAGK